MEVPPVEAPSGEVWGGGCLIIMCGLIVDLTKGRAGALAPPGGGMSAPSFSSRLVGRSGEAGGDWA